MTDIMTTDTQLAPDTKKTSKSRRHRRHRTSSSTKKKWIKILASTTTVSLILVACLSVLALINNREITQLSIANKKQERELNQLRPQVKEQEKQITELIQNRLPTLQSIQFDKVTLLEHEYLKNIVFTLTGKANINRYEFRMTAFNKGLNLIHPEFKIIFFNHLGIQVKELLIGVDNQGIPILEPLEPTESRSFSASIKLLAEDEQPQYFKIESKPSQNITFIE